MRGGLPDVFEFHHPHRSDRRRRAGPTAGIALTDAGIEATVYEAYQSSASGVGGALSIAPNGLDAWMRSAPVTIARYEELRRNRVEPIIAATARTNSNKAAGPVARVVRDRLMPVTMKLTRPEKATWQYDHHIDWAGAPRACPSSAAHQLLD
jgi:2-polyprenyl-6-methoxyphenol hydroxylase-like FAD-dependent oxidoreductase